MKTHIELYFPTPVMYAYLEDEIISSSLDIAKKFMADNNWKDKKNFGKTITTYYDSDNKNYLGDVNDTNMLHSIDRVSRQFLEALGLNYEVDLKVESWLNLNPPLSSHIIHEHYGTILGGVVYLECTEQSGELVFHDPVKTRTQAQTYNSKYRIESSQLSLPTVQSKPMPGKMILFESWVSHSVDTNKDDKDRISIAFNISTSKHWN